jgi:DNA-binding CsgD family transcriptional regulator/tetratricopeptide (TPR) repeat protein
VDAHGGPSEVALLEREAALAAVSATVEATRRGEHSVLFLIGEAGLGKTSLVTRARAAAGGLALGWAEGVAAETALPFGLLSQALALLRELEAVPGLSSAEARASLYQRCSRAMGDLCQTSPFLLLIDDLHWGDPDSLSLLGFLLRRLRGHALGVVATLRPWPPEAGDLAEELATAGQATVERLAPLGERSSAQVVVRAAHRELAPAELELALARCAGNPFLLTQTGAAAGAGGSAIGLYSDPNRRLVARFSGLAPEVVWVAKAASVAGTRFWPRLVAVMTGTSDAEVSAAVGALINAGLARAQDDGEVEFAHPLFAQALYESVERPERSRLHAAAMRGLLAMGAEPAKAAVHAQSGHLVGDQTAIDALEAAGRTALAVGALDGAVNCLTTAVELAGNLVAPTLLLELAEAEVATGRTERVKQTCLRALELATDIDSRLDALVMRARVAFSVNDDEAPYWTEAVRAAEGSEKQVGVLAEAVITMSKVVGPLAVAPWAARLRVLSAQVPPALRTEVDVAWGSVAAMAGQVEGTEAVRAALGAANLESVMGSASPMLFPRMLVLAINSRYLVERFDEADDLEATCWEIAERRGAVMTLTNLALRRAMGNYWRGRLADAHKALGDLAGIQAAARLREAQENWPVVLALLAVEEGDPSTALAEAGKAEPLVSAQNFLARTQLWRAQAELALDAGHTAEAVRLAREIRGLHQRLGILEPCLSPWADTAMVAFLRAGLLDEAQGLVGHLDMVAEGLPCRWPRSVAALGRAGLAEARGTLEEAEQRHRQAVHVLDGVGLPLRRARALLTYGRFLRRNGQPVLARGPLSEAIAESEACGGARFAAQARTELRASGGRRPRQSSKQLSPQEQSVAALAVEGATNEEIANQLFVSVKTVERHLTSAYTKLGIRSRKELQEHLPAP